METYEIETEDGEVYEVDVEGGEAPKQPNLMGKIGGALKTAKKASDQFQYGLTDTASFGLLDAANKLTGNKYKPGEGIARTAGEVGGFAFGGPAMVGKGAASMVPNAGRFAKGAITAGTGAASLAPKELAMGESTPEESAINIAGTAALGGAAEAIPNALMKGLFRKNIKRTKMDSLIEDIGKIKESIKSDPTQTVQAQPIKAQLQAIYDGMKGPTKKGGRVIKDWIDYLGDQVEVHADDILQIERDLGANAKFGGTKGGFFELLRPKNPVANEAIKAGRTVASDVYDDAATQAGFPEFGPKSRKIHDISKKFPDMDPSKNERDIGSRVGAALFAQAKTGSPLAALLTYLGEKAMQTAAVKQSIYKKLASKTGGKIGDALKQILVGTSATQDLGKEGADEE